MWTFLAFPFQSKEKHLPTFWIMFGDSATDPSSCKNWNFKPPFLRFFFSFFLFSFSWCALGCNSIPTLVCGLRNPFAIIIIIITTIIYCLACSHHQELSLAREGVTVYWNGNYLYNTYIIYILLQKVERLLHSNYAKQFFFIYLIHLSLKNNSN